jgi:hypothetical protein
MCDEFGWRFPESDQQGRLSSNDKEDQEELWMVAEVYIM